MQRQDHTASKMHNGEHQSMDCGTGPPSDSALHMVRGVVGMGNKATLRPYAN